MFGEATTRPACGNFTTPSARGPARLLWVTDADEDHPHGHVERLAKGFYRAAHRSLADTAWPTSFDKADWLSVLAASLEAVTSDRNAERGPQPALVTHVPVPLGMPRTTPATVAISEPLGPADGLFGPEERARRSFSRLLTRRLIRLSA